MKKKRMPTPGAVRYWNKSMSNWECDGDTCQLCFQLSFISMVISGPNQRILYVNYQKPLRFLSSDLSTIHFCTYRPEKGFFYSYQKNLRISSNLSTMFFCTFQPEAKACIHVSVWRNWVQTLQELIYDLKRTNRLLSKEISESTW
jgi:hypothetical protein